MRNHATMTLGQLLRLQQEPVHNITLATCDGVDRPMYGTYGDRAIEDHGLRLQIRESITLGPCFIPDDYDYVHTHDMPHHPVSERIRIEDADYRT